MKRTIVLIGFFLLSPFLTKAQIISVTVSSDTVCVGTVVNFNATETGIAVPNFKWIINGLSTGGDSSTFTVDSLTGNTVVYCFLTNSSGDSILASSDSIVISVVRPPSTIFGNDTICAGSMIVLSDSVLGGIWIDSFTNTISSTCNFIAAPFYSQFGAQINYDIIEYALSNACGSDTIFKNIIIEPQPDPYFSLDDGSGSGLPNYCIGSAAFISGSSDTGLYYYSTNSNAVIDAGSVYFANTGNVTIVCTDSNYCGVATFGDDIYILPPFSISPIIASSTTVCGGSSITLIDSSGLNNAYAECYWSLNNNNVYLGGNYSYSTVITGISPGSTTVTFEVNAACGFGSDTINIQINPPAPVQGINELYPNETESMYDSSENGIWSIKNDTIAAIGATSGLLSCLMPGIDTVVYTLPNGCFAEAELDINDSVPYTLSAGPVLCPGTYAVMSGNTGLGKWSSSNTSVASIDPVTGLLAALSPGTDTIIYSLPYGIVTKIMINVLSYPGSITVASNLCADSSTAIFDSVSLLYPTYGTWSSDNDSIATVGLYDGKLFGYGQGLAMIIHALPDGCADTAMITVTNCTEDDAIIFPNPAVDEATIQTDGNLYYAYCLSDIYGKALLQRPITGTFTEVDLRQFSPGIYIIKMFGYLNATRFFKVVKK